MSGRKRTSSIKPVKSTQAKMFAKVKRDPERYRVGATCGPIGSRISGYKTEGRKYSNKKMYWAPSEIPRMKEDKLLRQLPKIHPHNDHKLSNLPDGRSGSVYIIDMTKRKNNKRKPKRNKRKTKTTTPVLTSHESSMLASISTTSIECHGKQRVQSFQDLEDIWDIIGRRERQRHRPPTTLAERGVRQTPSNRHEESQIGLGRVQIYYPSITRPYPGTRCRSQEQVMSETVFYQPGMSLGRTFDLRTYGNGLDIFPDDLVDNPKIIERHHNVIKYKVIKNSQDVNNILDLSGEVALKIKAGILNIGGMGSYLKEDKFKDECTEIFVRAHVETLTETLTDLSPRHAWREHLIGSHFIRSITYGGDLLVRIRIKGSDRAKIEEIESKFKADIGGFKLAEAKVKLDKNSRDIQDDIETEIEYLSTSVDCEMPRDMEGLLRVLKSFKGEMLKINNGKGVPCKCELLPLSVLDSTIPTQTKDKSLDMLLVQVDEKFDDLRFAKKQLEKFVENPSLELTEILSEEYEELEGRIDDILDEFHHVIGRLDMTESGDGPSQFTHILSVYKEKKKIGGFQKEVTLFIKRHRPEESPECPQPSEECRETPPCASSDTCKESPTDHEAGLSILALEKGGSSEACVLEQVLFQETNQEHVAGVHVSRTVRGDMTLVKSSCLFAQSPPGQCLSDIGTSIAYAPLGFHAIVFVIYIDQNMHKQDRNTLKRLRSVFGSKAIKNYAAVALMHDDVFEARSELSFSNSIETAKAQDDTLAHLLDECNNRCVFINLKDLASPGELQIAQRDLLQVIDKVVVKTRRTTLTNDYFVLSKRLMAEEEEHDNLAWALDDSLGKESETVTHLQSREERVGAKLAKLFET